MRYPVSPGLEGVDECGGMRVIYQGGSDMGKEPRHAEHKRIAVTCTVDALTTLPLQPLLPMSLGLTLAQPLRVLLFLLLLVPPGQLLHLQGDKPGTSSVSVCMPDFLYVPHLDRTLPAHPHSQVCPRALE